MAQDHGVKLYRVDAFTARGRLGSDLFGLAVRPIDVVGFCADKTRGKVPDELQNLPVTVPIIVRDFAAALRLKPFKLIAELNQLGGFAVLNTTIEESVAQKIARNYGFQLKITRRRDDAPR